MKYYVNVMSDTISNLNSCLVNIFKKLTQRLIQNNKTVIEIKVWFLCF